MVDVYGTGAAATWSFHIQRSAPLWRYPQRRDLHRLTAGAHSLWRGAGEPGANEVDKLLHSEAVGA